MDCGERYTGNRLGYGKKIRTEWIFSKEVKADAGLAIIFFQLGKNYLRVVINVLTKVKQQEDSKYACFW